MPDITMCCNNDGCKIKDTCYRNTAKPSEHQQSYDYFYLNLGESGECKMFMDNNERGK
jgi:hypothetical protein